MDWHTFFDTPIDRKGTSCEKFDGKNPHIPSDDVLPLWVADMDFRVPPAAQEALHKRVDHGIFGYTFPSDAYKESACSWISRHAHWTPDPQTLTVTPGVVFALAQAVRVFSDPGDAVLIQPPVYYPFKSVVLNNGRKLVRVPLAYDATLAREG